MPEIFTSETTAPPFCASPVMSRVRECLPSITAAVASTADTVTTPVPPMPVIRMEKPAPPPSYFSGVGVGRAAASSEAARAAGTFFFSPGVTVTNDGQSPDRQEKSRLQEDWSIWVLRPNSVSTG